MDKNVFNPEIHLSNLGWTKGSGLGREEDGIKEALKVKLKFDQAGVGHNEADQFTFHWWDHTFNKAANNIQVKDTEDGVEIQSSSTIGEISSKKKTINVDKKDMLYGRFVKASTLTAEGEVKAGKTKPSRMSDDSSSSSDSELEGADVGTASKLTDEQLMKICGGRTAHKGARHGLRLNGKLARIAEQETGYLSSVHTTPINSTPASPQSSANNSDEHQRDKEIHKRKKAKKMRTKKERSTEVNDEDTAVELHIGQESSISKLMNGEKTKKHRKKHKFKVHQEVEKGSVDDSTEVSCDRMEEPSKETGDEGGTEHEKKKKKLKRVVEVCTSVSDDKSISRKNKKKKNKDLTVKNEDTRVIEEPCDKQIAVKACDDTGSAESNLSSKKKSSRKRKADYSDTSVCNIDSVKKKKKKKNRSKQYCP